VYNPPQLLPQSIKSWYAGFAKINVIDHRASLFAGCAKASVCMAAPCCNIDVFQMSDPDKSFEKLLASCHPNCPDMMKGVILNPGLENKIRFIGRSTVKTKQNVIRLAKETTQILATEQP